MHAQLDALADPARWRIVEVLAERPRSVGSVADLCGLRQPQATKHLQTLERAGLAVSRRSGQRRIYALVVEALQSLEAEIRKVAEVASAHADERARFDAYAASVDSEIRAADRAQWADGREFVFTRTLAADRQTVWNHLTRPDLLEKWWTTNDLRLSKIVFSATSGDRIEQEYVDIDSRPDSADVVGRAVGAIDAVEPGGSISFHLSPLLADGTVGFTAHYRWTLAVVPSGTEIALHARISDSTVQSAEFVAGIQLGWDQCLDNLAALFTSPLPAK